jgi:hypothetical protein
MTDSPSSPFGFEGTISRALRPCIELDELYVHVLVGTVATIIIPRLHPAEALFVAFRIGVRPSVASGLTRGRHGPC